MKIVRNNIAIGKWYHGQTLIPQAYCNDKLVFPNIYSDVEEGYDVMCSGTINDYEGTAPEVYVMSVSKWYMRTTGGNYKEYGVYGDNKNDPYVGELVVVDGHEWEYTSSGWVDLGEGESGKIQEYFISQKSSDPFDFKLEHYWNTGYRMVVDFFLNGTYSSDVGGIIRAYNGESLFELNLYNNGYYLDWHAPTSTSSPTTSSGDYTYRDMNTGLSTQMPKNKTRLLMELKAGTKATIFNYDTGVQLGTYGTIYDTYTYCTTGKYKVGIRRNSANNTSYIHGIKVYDNNNNLVNDFEVKYRGGSGSNQFYVQDNVDKTIYEDLSGSTNIVYEVIETGETVLPKYYTDLDAPDPIDYGYYTSPDEYLKNNDNYYKKDYVTEIYSGGCEVITTEYVQGDQLTPTYVQGEASDFIVYDGGRYYKNYIYVTPVSTPIATGDYVRGEYIGTADIIISGVTKSSSNFTVKLNNTDVTANIISTSGSNYNYAVYGDLNQSLSTTEFAKNNSNLISCHIITSGVTSIGSQAFYSCGNLTTVTLPDSVTGIGSNSFQYCSKLTDFNIPNTVTSIGSRAFLSCSSLTSINIPNGILSIQDSTFSGCTSLESVILPDTLLLINSYAFYGCSKLTSINIPNTVSSIYDNAFSKCTKLETFHLGSGCGDFRTPMFDGTYVLTTITVDSNNATFDSRDNCNAIIKKSNNQLVCGCNNTVIPNTVTSIGDKAFFGLNRMNKELTIPSSVTSIGNQAFNYNYGVVIHMESATPPTLGSSAFNNHYSIIYVPVGTSATYKGATNWSNYASRIYEEGTDFSTKPVTGTASGGTAAMSFGNSTRYNGTYYGAGKFFIDAPLTATTVGYYSNYKSSTNITSIDLSRMANLTTIHESAFNGYGNPNMLTSVILPDTVTTIMDYAFSNQRNLTSINIPSSLVTIGVGALQAANLGLITLPSTVTSIGRNAFYECNDICIHIEATTPPTLGDDFIPYSWGLIFVPVGTSATYKGATNWRNYASRIYEEGETPWANIPIKCKGGGYFMGYYNTQSSSGGRYIYVSTYDSNRNSYPISDLSNVYKFWGAKYSITYADFREFTQLTDCNDAFVDNNTKVKGIRLPSSVTKYSPVYVNGTSSVVDYITIDAVTPPTWVSGTSNGTIRNFYVPDESVNAYKTATGWITYASIIKPMSDFATDFPNE